MLAVVPPFSTWARHTEVVETLQFCLLAVAVPCLVALGAPWRSLGLAARHPNAAGSRPPRALDGLAEGRRRHPQLLRSLAFVAADLAVVVAWRTPAAIEALVRHGALGLLEALSLVAAGIGLWLECVESPPLVPRSPRPQRALVAALAMWTMWILAYLLGFSRTSWYAGLAHRAGHGLSAAADQQFSSVVLWAVPAVFFAPVIFYNVLTWLHSEDDPDDELYRLIREERRRGWASPRPLGGPGAHAETPPGPGAGAG